MLLTLFVADLIFSVSLIKHLFFINLTQLISFIVTDTIIKVLSHLKKLGVLPVYVFNIFGVIATKDTALLPLGWLLSVG